MSMNGIQGYSQIDAYSAYNLSKKSTNKKSGEAETSTSKSSLNDTGVIYEKSTTASDETTENVTYKQNTSLIEQLKADAAAHEQQLMSMVQQSLSGQLNAFSAASGNSDDIWKFLASGNYSVSSLAKEKAQQLISEDGYYGVSQTSDRILEMAKALTGGDPDKIEEMREAFKKGYDQATKSWGKELPEISSKTYDAVMEKFDSWANESNQ